MGRAAAATAAFRPTGRRSFPAFRKPARSAASPSPPPSASLRTGGSSSPRRAGSSRSSTTSPTRRRRSSPTCAPRSTTSGTAACSGWRSTRTSRPSRTSTSLYTYDAADRRHGPALGPAWRHVRRLSDPARARRATAASSAAGSRGCRRRRRPDGRRRAGAARGLVPAVPEPLDRQPVRGGRRALRQRRRRRELQLRRLRAGRQPAQPLRRPAGGVGGTPDAADRRGWRAAQPGPAHRRRPDRLSTARSCGSIPTPAAALPDNPLAASSDPNARRIVAYGLRNPFRFTFRPGTSEIWIGDVGWSDWEEINRDPRPDGSASTTSAGPATRAAGARPGYDARRTSTSARPLRRRRRGHGAVLHLQAQARSCTGETCPTGSSSISGIAFYDGGHVPGRVRRGAVLRRLLARLHLGDAAGTGGAPDPRRIETFAPGPRTRSTSSSVPAATSSTPTSTAGAIQRIHYTVRQPAADGGRRRRRRPAAPRR